MSPDEMIAPRVSWQPARTTRDAVGRFLSSPIAISVMLAVFACPEGPAEEPAAAPNTGALRITDHDRDWWSFKPPRRSEPAIAGDASWARQPLDRFILARLRQRGLEPSSEASRATIIRRLTFDLTGLPPSPEDVDAFVADPSPDPIGRLVVRLLDSPRFGERMASVWLPLARFAEDQAHQVGDDTKFFYPNAGRYRAWVIDSFNRDLPYDTFLKFQLAADKLPAAASDDLAALGFLGLGPKYYNRNRLEVQADEWEDRVDTVTRTMLGLTVACARCHDHKFDPITTRDYYALAGIFASTRMVNKTAAGRVEKDGTKAEKMDPATLHIVEDGEVRNLNVFQRGNVELKGELVDRRFIEVLSPGRPRSFTEGSGRRELAEAIANRDNPLTARVFVNRVWGAFFGRPLVASTSNFGHRGDLPSHPELLDDLAVRFIEGGWSIKALVREIVLSATYRQASGQASGISNQCSVTSNLSAGRGERPDAFSSPVLGSWKKNAERDFANESLWRMNRRRLSVEQWRDATLAVSGELDLTPAVKSCNIDDPANRQRSVFARVSRLKLGDLLIQFDYPDANVHAEGRSTTTTPMQKLFFLNSPFVQQRAAALATRLLGAADTDTDRLSLAYRLLFAREPDQAELELARQFLHNDKSSDVPRWEKFTQVLLASNEFLYVD